MAINFAIRGAKVAAWKTAMLKNKSLMARASTATAHEAAAEIKRLGDADISRAGQFGPRWQKSLTVFATPKHGALLNSRVTAQHEIPYAGIHETGGVIRGKPLLWIPLSFNEHITRRKRARDWGRAYGGLFRVNRKGGKNPLLFSIRDPKPLYVGVKQVTLRKRFHLTEIMERTAKKMGAVFDRHVNTLKKVGR